MQGSSRIAAAAVDDALDQILATEADRSRLSDDLFGITGAVDSTIALRRALADPSRDPEAKAGIVDRLFGNRVSVEAAQLTKAAVGQRWSHERDLTDTLETSAVAALVAAAERDGQADQLEDELFRFERIVSGNPSLRDALTDRRANPRGKEELVDRLLGGKALPGTVRLARQAVGASRGRRFDQVMDHFLEVASARRDQLSAVVTSAVALDGEQQRRLAAALSQYYDGKRVHLNLLVDPTVLGGIRVQIGDDVVDGTILRRLEAARRHLGA